MSAIVFKTLCIGDALATMIWPAFHRDPVSSGLPFLLPCGVLLAVLANEGAVLALGKFLPFVGLLATTLLPSACATCRGAFDLHPILPLLGSAYFVFALVALNSDRRWMRRSALASSWLVPIVQFGLMWQSPRACPYCAIVTLAGAGLAVFFERYPRRTSAPSLPTAGLGGAFALAVCLYHGAVVAGRIPGLDEPRARALRDFRGADWRDFIRTPHEAPSATPSVLVLTRIGCHPCQDAKRALASRGLSVSDAVDCADDPSAECFSSPQVVTPTFLFLDRRGRVIDQYIGMPSTASKTKELLDRISLQSQNPSQK